jgi:hypothetical protein
VLLSMISLLAIVVMPVAFAGGVLVALDVLGLAQDGKPRPAAPPFNRAGNAGFSSAVFTPLDAESASGLAEAAEVSPAPLPAFDDLTAEEQHLVLRVMRSVLGTDGTGEARVA